MPQFITKENGDVVPITPRKLRLGTLLATGAVAIAAGLGFGVEGVGVGTGAVAGADSPTLTVQARTARGGQRSGQTRRRLATRGLRETFRAERDSTSCAADARGEVRDFLATHPCESVYRTLLQVRRGDAAVLVAVAWIDMVKTADASQLKALVDRPGTGNVNQLPPPRGSRPVDAVEPAYASRQRGTLVVTVEAEPTAVTRNQRLLEQIADEVAEEARVPS